MYFLLSFFLYVQSTTKFLTCEDNNYFSDISLFPYKLVKFIIIQFINTQFYSLYIANSIVCVQNTLYLVNIQQDYLAGKDKGSNFGASKNLGVNGSYRFAQGVKYKERILKEVKEK